MDDRKIPPESLCNPTELQVRKMKEKKENFIEQLKYEIRVQKETKSKPAREIVKKYVFENEN